MLAIRLRLSMAVDRILHHFSAVASIDPFHHGYTTGSGLHAQQTLYIVCPVCAALLTKARQKSATPHWQAQEK